MTVDQDMLIAYALGILDAAEAREVERYLESHPEAAAEVRDYLAALADEVMKLEPEADPKGATEGLLARVRAETGGAVGGAAGERVLERPAAAPKRTDRSKLPLWLGLAAAAALALLVFFGLPALRPETPPLVSELERYTEAPGAVTQALLDDEGQRVGTLVRLPDDRLFMALERPPPEDQVYQAWEIVDGVPLSLGVTDGAELLIVGHEVTPGGLFGVTEEPPGGSEQPTSAPVALAEL